MTVGGQRNTHYFSMPTTRYMHPGTDEIDIEVILNNTDDYPRFAR